MPTYEEILEQSHVNIQLLNEKTQHLDKLCQDIKKLIKQPEIFEGHYKDIVNLSTDFTNTLGAAAKKYIDGNNTLITTKLKELSDKTKDLQKEVERLENTDFIMLFQGLQKSFLVQAKKDIADELKNLDDKSAELQTKIDALAKEVTRLSKIDLVKHFEKLQKTLADIFGAVNSINITLSNTTQTLTSIVQSLGSVQVAIDANHKELKQRVDSQGETFKKLLTEQYDQFKRHIELVQNEVISLAEQNQLLKKQGVVNRIIQIISSLVILGILTYLIIR